ncbi:MAG: hypothetical protein AB8B87_19195 [Granulosicoccus sp.]
MTNIDPDNPTEENMLAYAAIALFGNSAKGAVPQWQELAAWRQGTLDSKRSDEVLSHVANDPAYFQQWLDIAEAESWIEEEARIANESPSTVTDPLTNTSPESSNKSEAKKVANNAAATKSLVSRFTQAIHALFQQPLPVYGGAFAAVLLAVLIAPLLQTGDGLSLQSQLDRSTDTYISTGNGLTGAPPVGSITRQLSGLFDELSKNEVEQYHVQKGIQTFYEKLQDTQNIQTPLNDAWQDWLARLPAESLDCNIAVDPSHCRTAAEDLQLLGQWSLMNVAACNLRAEQAATVLQTEFLTEQYSVYAQIQSLPVTSQSLVFARVLPVLKSQSPEALCAIANAVLAASQ